ncbi:MAG: hypothetical protein ABI557_18575 [Aureliella sp.]
MRCWVAALIIPTRRVMDVASTFGLINATHIVTVTLITIMQTRAACISKTTQARPATWSPRVHLSVTVRPAVAIYLATIRIPVTKLAVRMSFPA